MTRAVLILLGHSLKRVRTLVGVMALVFATFQVFTSLMAATFQENQTFASLFALVPDFVRDLLGDTLLGMLSFAGVVCLSYFHFAVIGALVGLSIALATEPTTEIDIGFADLILSRPLARSVLITRTILVVVICATFVLSAMALGTWIGVTGLAPEGAVGPTPRLVLSLTANLGALMLCWGGIALAFSAAARRRSTAASAAGLLALGMFLFDVVSRAWKPLKAFAQLSPFHYYNPLNIVLGREVPLAHLGTLLGLGLAGACLAYLLYGRRDI